MLDDILIDEQLVEAIAAMDIDDYTDVQQVVIPLVLEGRDVVVNAKTGSGKTLAFILPMLQQILDNPKPESPLRTQALILAPTRELCRQINKQISMLGKFTDIRSIVIIGGDDPKYQIKSFKQYPDIIVATPGRLLQHIERNAIDLESINILVIDEADRMLDMGFSESVITISKMCSHECQTSMYSASFSEKRFMPLIQEIMYDPEVILIDLPRESHENIKQQKICVDGIEHKQKVCEALIKRHKSDQILIFINKKQTAESLVSFLQSQGIATAVLHGDIDQNIRNEQLRKFRNHDVNVIVATDVASRGLDIEGLDLVINYDIPKNANDYIHRIGRTGRMNQTGTAMNLVSSDGWNKLISIENYIGQKCELVSLAEAPSIYNGPDRVRKSGKAWGPKAGKNRKKKKVNSGQTERQHKKTRERDRKNIGKRRLPSNKD